MPVQSLEVLCAEAVAAKHEEKLYEALYENENEADQHLTTAEVQILVTDFLNETKNFAECKMSVYLAMAGRPFLKDRDLIQAIVGIYQRQEHCSCCLQNVTHTCKIGTIPANVLRQIRDAIAVYHWEKELVAAIYWGNDDYALKDSDWRGSRSGHLGSQLGFFDIRDFIDFLKLTIDYPARPAIIF
jgi:hypothetical protein